MRDAAEFVAGAGEFVERRVEFESIRYCRTAATPLQPHPLSYQRLFAALERPFTVERLAALFPEAMKAMAGK